MDIGLMRPILTAIKPLVGATIDAGSVGWVNPEETAILISKVVVDVTTIATAAGTLSVGYAATNVSANNLIDTLDCHSATGTFDNITDKGSSGKSRQKCASGYYVTFNTASGALAGMVANAYITYTRI